MNRGVRGEGQVQKIFRMGLLACVIFRSFLLGASAKGDVEGDAG
jgi:hypothetical protein